MQKCEKCNNQFSWSQIYKSLGLYRPIQCKQCNTPHRITFASRIILSLLVVAPVWVFGFMKPTQLSLSTSNTVSIMILYFILISLCFPLIVKYNSDSLVRE